MKTKAAYWGYTHPIGRWHNKKDKWDALYEDKLQPTEQEEDEFKEQVERDEKMLQEREKGLFTRR